MFDDLSHMKVFLLILQWNKWLLSMFVSVITQAGYFYRRRLEKSKKSWRHISQRGLGKPAMWPAVTLGHMLTSENNLIQLKKNKFYQFYGLKSGVLLMSTGGGVSTCCIAQSVNSCSTCITGDAILKLLRFLHLSPQYY